jgi:methylated-DNA-[protein]-cysteine S-methyltransferase
MTTTTVSYTIADTPFGSMLVAGYGSTLCAIKFGVGARNLDDALSHLRHETHDMFHFVRDDAAIGPLVRQVQDYLAGKRTSFDLKLDLSYVTTFQREVLHETYAIPRGQIATYGEIARRVGRPRAFRAVGNTMRLNPIPIVIPCHRVVGTNGDLTGFGGGLSMKRRLLELEGAVLG